MIQKATLVTLYIRIGQHRTFEYGTAIQQCCIRKFECVE